MKMSGAYYIANTTSAADAAAVQRSYDFSLGWFSESWTETGDYPESMKQTLGDLLPTLDDTEKAMLKGSQDFYAIDGYSTYVAAAPPGGIEACASNSSNPYWPGCTVSSTVDASGFPLGPAADVHSEWLWSTPVGIRGFLNVITKTLFPSITDIVVSEFGFVEPYEGERTVLSEILWDLRRSDYFQGASRIISQTDGGFR